MADRENVIKALECCKRKDGNECKVCPHTESDFCVEDMVTDALALLKEQHELLVKKQKDLNHALNDCAEYRHKIAEQPQIVRCKDCDNQECVGRDNRIVCGITGEDHLPDWFCADGERK